MHIRRHYIYHPKDADPINGLLIKNVGNVIATNVTIEVSEVKKQKIHWGNEKGLSTKTTFPLIIIDEDVPIINSKLHNVPEIKVKVIYHSPFNNREIKIEERFKRNQS
jgi:hypothetical protein